MIDLLEWPQTRSLTSNVGEDVEQQGLSFTCGGNGRGDSHCGRQFHGFLQS
jgi:hypothetical protein